MALVPEERPLEEGRGGDDAGLRARAQPQQFELRRDELRRLLRVRRRARAAAVDVRREVMDLLAVLVGDLRAALAYQLAISTTTDLSRGYPIESRIRFLNDAISNARVEACLL